MINSILMGLLTFFNTLLSIAIYPLDTILATYLPNIDSALAAVGVFLNSVLGVFPWLLSWFHIPSYLLTLVLTWAVAKLYLMFAAYSAKLVIRWWDKLKL